MSKRIEKLNEFSISKLKKTLDGVIAKYLKSIAPRRGGKVQCWLYGTWHDEKQVECCHYIDRAHMSTRWLRDNLRICSKWTNRFDANHKTNFGVKLLHEMGVDKFKELTNLKEERFKPSKNWLIEKIEFYRKNLKELDNSIIE